MKNNNVTLGELVKKVRKDKKISARKLAELCDVSHTEINNIESGIRIKPALLTLKGFEKYLDLDFNKTAKMVGYSDETIKYGAKNIIVSYEMYDKIVNDYRTELDHILFKLDQKRHLGMDIREYLDSVKDYLTKQKVLDTTLKSKIDSIYSLLDEIEKKYESTLKDK